MKNPLKMSGHHFVLSLSTALVALTGCGGGGGSTAVPPMGQTPYPYPTGQSTYPVPGGLPNGPIQVPTGTQCASALPALTGLPTPLSAITDGEDGCIRLVSVQQYQDTAANGYFINSIVGETDLDYHFTSVSTRRQRRRGIQLNALAASVSSRTTCSDIRSAPLGTPGAAIDLPLWIDRSSGSIGQNIRVTTGRTNNYVLARGNISAARQGWNLNSFVANLNAQGFQAVTAAKLPSGDYEIFLSRTSVAPGTGATIRNVTRAVYSMDY